MSDATPLRLDTTACDRCGRCGRVCKPKALRIGPGYIQVDWDLCTSCGKCADVCDRGAIALRSGAAVAVDPAPSAAKAAPKDVAKPKKGAAVPAAVPSAPKPRPARGSGSGVEWSLPEAALVLVVAFSLLVGAQALLGGLMSAPAWGGLALLVYDGLLAALIAYLARRHGASVLTALRLNVVPDWRSVALVLPVAIGCWLFSVTYRATVLSFGLTPPASEGTDLTTLFGSGLLGIVLTVAAVAVVGPILEEALLRGVVLTALRRRFGEWPAVLAGALAFALLHASVWSLLPLTVLGAGLGWLAVRSRSLWPAVVAHVLYNGVLVGAALYAAAG
jgi:membrane protease YdiL (CAAX protease family)/NAD-dependent dihydropyrimidine dehydrogenase PreA subunit